MILIFQTSNKYADPAFCCLRILIKKLFKLQHSSSGRLTYLLEDKCLQWRK